MLDFDENPPPKDLAELWSKLCALVRSMHDWTFRDAVQLTASTSGERVAHGGRSAPLRMYQSVGDSAAAPVLQVVAKDDRFVTVISSADAVVDLAFQFGRR